MVILNVINEIMVKGTPNCRRPRFPELFGTFWDCWDFTTKYTTITTTTNSIFKPPMLVDTSQP